MSENVIVNVNEEESVVNIDVTYGLGITNVVDLTSDQSISGHKTFNDNVTLDGPTLIKSASCSESLISASNIDWSSATTFHKALTANTTFTFSNAENGKCINVAVTNTPSNYTVAWPVEVKWSDGETPVQTIGNKTDIYIFFQINGVLYGSIIQNF